MFVRIECAVGGTASDSLELVLMFCFVSARRESVNILGAFPRDLFTLLHSCWQFQRRRLQSDFVATLKLGEIPLWWFKAQSILKETGSHCWPVRSSEIINDVFTSSFEFLETYWRGERCEISSVLDVQTRSNRFEVVVSCSFSVLICSSSHRPPVEENLPLRNGGPYSSSSDKLSSAGKPRRRNDYDDYNSSGDELDDDDFDR